MFKELQDEYENKVNKFLRPNGKILPLRSFLLSFVMLLFIGAVAYCDYFLDGDDYFFPMLTIIIIIVLILMLFSALGVIVGFLKKK